MKDTHQPRDSDSKDPSEVLEMYLKEKQIDYAKSTVQTHKSRLSHFIDYMESIDRGLNELAPIDIHEFRIKRSDDGINKVTLKSQLDTLRVFLRWAGDMGYCPDGTHKAVKSPNVEGENQRSDMVELEKAEQILDYLEKYEYCSLRHITTLLMFKTGMRVGGVHSLDVDDWDADEQALKLRHRPKQDTTLKNQQRGERKVSVKQSTAQTITDWIEDQRPDVEDEHGREPLLATSHGRAHKETLRLYAYQVTRPCEYASCPDNKEGGCEAESYNSASKCPFSQSSHAFRRLHITQLLKEDVPVTVVSDRVNSSADVIEKHYNQMTETEKMEQRKQYLDDV
jgi:site-specific recombinase XerD